jgi:uncharacterized protein YecE (DUF72 family)
VALGGASWGYLRLRRPGYERADLVRWARRVQREPWDQAFVFFKHEDEGAGPKLAAEFLDTVERSVERRGPLSATPARTRREAG